MRTKLKTIVLHHPIGDIKIQPATDVNLSAIMHLLSLFLDGYLKILEETHVPASIVHDDTKKRYEEYYQTPGYFLKLYRQRVHLTQAHLADKLGIKQHHISEMENNKRVISPTMAKQIAKNLHIDYRKFL